MSCISRLICSGTCNRPVSKFLSSSVDFALLQQSEAGCKIILRPYVPVAPVRRSTFGNQGSLPCLSSKFMRLQSPGTTASQMKVQFSARQFVSNLSFAIVPLANSVISNSCAAKSNNIGHSSFLESQSRSQNHINGSHQLYTCTQKYSTPDKPLASQQTSEPGSGLAAEIMQSRMAQSDKESAHAQEGEPKSGESNREDSPKGPKPMGKWQKRGYMAFVVLLGGSLVVNAVLFGKYLTIFNLTIARFFASFKSPQTE